MNDANRDANLDVKLAETIQFIRRRSSLQPKLGFVLGSGLSGFAHQVQKAVSFSFHELPHFISASVEGHPGKLWLGSIENVPVSVLQGRLHAYEGLSFEQVMYPMRTLTLLGASAVLVSNAAGGLKRTMRPGDFMVIEDHINLSGENPLRGANWQRGPRFVDMTEPYDKKLTSLLSASLRKNKVRHHKGVYVGVMGPTYETAAEIRFYNKIGGGSVGMSTIADVVAARHAGVRVVGLSCITNLGTGLSKVKLSHAEVKRVAERVEDQFVRTLVDFVRRVKSHL